MVHIGITLYYTTLKKGFTGGSALTTNSKSSSALTTIYNSTASAASLDKICGNLIQRLKVLFVPALYPLADSINLSSDPQQHGWLSHLGHHLVRILMYSELDHHWMVVPRTSFALTIDDAKQKQGI